MRVSHRFRTALIAFAAVAGLALTAPAARADSGSISFSIIKAGIVIGGSAGSGVLHFHGRSYRISIGGISYGFTFGASETRFHGTVSHIRRASDVAGVYAAAGAGVARRAGRAGDRAHQPERRGAHHLRPLDRRHRRRRPQRHGDYGALSAARAAGASLAGIRGTC